MTETRECHVCGGAGWVDSRPTGYSNCPTCKGTGRTSDPPLPKIKDLPADHFLRRWLGKLGAR